MYLKKIHIQGFKSFADKTEIKFKNNITAIVGPNGSGKSNISDAIRWVLGEQSVKSLRGSKMEDIIFSGTSKRRALSFAEVTIFFDNTDGSIPLEFSEVAVTRRMFRSGESEYYINKNGCRLKDIRTLFMDTGIGKDGYSIIGQGRIDEILSNKPEDRRNIFEEAAGIIKYKSRKEESERKLKNTQENLIRIDDLISEIEIQSQKLEKDSIKANEFIESFEEVKILETNISTNDIKAIDEDSKEIQNRIDEIEKDIIEHEYKKNKNQNVFDILKKNIEEKEKDLEVLRKNRDESLQSKEDAKNNISLLIEKENFNKKDLGRLNLEIKDIKNENITLDKEISNLEIKEKELKMEYQEKLTKYDYEEIKLNNIDEEIKMMEEYIDTRKVELDLLYEKIADKKGKLSNMDFSNLNGQKEIEDLNYEKEELAIKMKKNKDKTNNLLLEKEIFEKDLKDQIENKLILQSKIENIQVSLEKNIKRIRELEMESERVNLNYKLYQNMQYSYEGYYKSVKNLLIAIKNKTLNNKGFHGVVADLLSVEDKFETAINIALGASAQNVVVENENDAKYMINYLKTNKLGRATFLPISTIKGNRQIINIKKFNEKSILGLAHELIEYDKKYENIFKSLLARTIIIDNLDNAVEFAKKTNNTNRIVTLEGEILNPGGSLSGGSYKGNISIINRINKIEELKLLLETIEEKLSLEKNKKATLDKEFIICRDKISISKESIDKSNKKLINIEGDIRSLESEYSFSLQDVNRIGKQIEIIIRKSKETIENSVKDTNALELETLEFDKIKNYIGQKTEELKVIKFKKDATNKALGDMKINIRLIESELLNLKDKIKNNSQKYRINKIAEEKKLQDTKLIDNSLATILDEKEVSNNIVKNNSKICEKIEESIKEAIKQKDLFMEEFYKEQDKLKSLNENISILSKNRNDGELEISKLEIKKDNIKNNLLNDYNLTLEEAFNLEKPIENIRDSRKRVKSLKMKIKQLGNVNVSAIEEYKEVHERFHFMKTQQNDLIESKENLKNIIRDMEKEMKINFFKSFEEIKSNFTEVFAELFNGGIATLELEDEEEDILLAGIEIKVQPPGKTLQSLSLLSGGEKSLVAVALLFAILKTKPAPFCVLDEIDAALDDANINRYTSYLKKINEDTQFILITHRKTSMEIANVLYGVTMEEKGISRMISMKLKENENELVS